MIATCSGANFIHGHSPTNPISHLVEETGTTLHTLGESQAAFSPTGKQIPQSLVDRASESFWSIIADAFQYSNEHSEKINPNRSLLDFIKEKVDDKYPPGKVNGASESDLRFKDTDGGVNSTDAERKLVLSEAEAWGGFVGGVTSRQSLRFFWLEECIEGENPFMAGTYGKVLERIAAPALKGTRLLFGHSVSRIRTDHESNEGKEALTKSNDDQEATSGSWVIVEAEDKNFAESFDEVVVTLPLGYLQKHKDNVFQPKLGTRLGKAIQGIGYGSLDKVSRETFVARTAETKRSNTS